MDKFVIRMPKVNKNLVGSGCQTPPEINIEPLQKQRRVEVNSLDLPRDPS